MKDGYGYAMTRRNKKLIAMHRLIKNCPDDLVVDHLYPISKGICDNRKSNLEIKTQKENATHPGMYAHNTSGHRGVYFVKKKNNWLAQIRVNGKDIRLGYFDDIKDAIKARQDAEIKYFGKYVSKDD